MGFTTYTVTCEKCGGHDELKITDNKQVFYTEHTPIISARFRPDMQWGFECLCGQDSRIALEEKASLQTIVKNASDSTIEALAKSLRPKSELMFKMELK